MADDKPHGAPGSSTPASGPGNAEAVSRRDGRARTRRPSRLSLKNWRVRSRLLALIALPTLIAVILGGVRLVSSARSALGYQRVVALANLGGKITALAQTLEDERDTTVGYVAQGRPSGMAQVVQQDYRYSDYRAGQVAPLARGIGGGYPAETRAQAAAVVTGISGLSALRKAALSSKLPSLVIVQDYTRTIDDLLALDDGIAQGSGDPTLAGTVRELGLVSRMKEEASQQRAILNAALTRGQFLPGELNALEAAQAEEVSNLAVFNTSATVTQRQQYLDTVTGSLVTRADNQEQNAISLAGPAASGAGGSLRRDITSAGDWYGSMSDVIVRMRAVESNLIGAAISRSAALRSGAITSAAAGSGAVLLVLLISVVFTALVVRSMVGPLRQLRTGALDVAGVRLPEMVRKLGNSEDGQVPADVDPIDVDSADEIGEVARAFDQVHREALRLAANEALLRGNVNAMFVNLSRRTQSLVERQLEVIDELEQGEADSARLASLFKMDHFATRMRRNSENLLVLAGHEGARRRSRPVPLLDVLRAAVSEIEQYARVHLEVQPGIAVHGQAVGDIVHLVSELVENATAFSPVETPVTLSGQMQNGGGLLLEITDNGIGLSADEMAHANWRLDNPPVVDVAVSRRMGLFVVGRLAARNGIRVRLRPAADGGLTALIWLPDELVIHEALGTVPGSWSTVTGPQPVVSGHPDAPAGPQPVAGARADGPASPEPIFGAPVAAAAPPHAPARPIPVAAVPPQGRPPGAPPSQPGKGAAPSRPDEREVPSRLDKGAMPSRPDDGAVPSRLPGEGATAEPSPGVSAAQPPEVSPAQPSGVSPAQPSGVPPGLPSGAEPAKRPAGTEPYVVPLPAHEKIAPARASAGPEPDPVAVPPGVNGGRNRLPIFDSVESDWFRRGSGSGSGRDISAGIDPVSGPGRTEATDEGNWTSPGDEGWQAADAARAPVSGGITEAGLPRRVPRANLVPGSAKGPGAGEIGGDAHRATAPEPAGAGRSPQEIRERLARFQRGARAGHAAGRSGQLALGEEEWEGNA